MQSDIIANLKVKKGLMGTSLEPQEYVYIFICYPAEKGKEYLD